MFKNVLTPAADKLLSGLTPSSLPKSSYLAGGTAVALQLGHRKSVDLDFFTQTKFVEQQWEEKLKQELDFKLVTRDWQTLAGSASGVKISLLGYPHKLIRKPLMQYKIPIASLPDLSAMKLDTIIGRGAKRDFVDIYFLAQKFTLPEILNFYDEKYANLDERELMIKKGLIYFTEADKEPMPDMLAEADWAYIKKWIIEEVRKLQN